MKIVDLHDAKKNLSSLILEVREGRESEITICVSGRPVAKLVPIAEVPRRLLGVDRGRITLAPDFDAVDSEMTALFSGL